MRSRIIAVLATAVGLGLALASPAQAAAPRSKVVYSSSTYMTGDVAVHGDRLAVLACSTVNEVLLDGTAGALPYPGCSGHVEQGGIAWSADGESLATTTTVHTMGPQSAYSSLVVRRGDDDLWSANISAVEFAKNPDAAQRYGTTSRNTCVTRALGADASYTGRLDSAASAVAAAPDGSWYVADRAANTIYRVSASGSASVLAVLAPVKVTVSSSLARELRWPRCVVGSTVAFEASPTEIEVGADGTVYVAGLPTLQSGIRNDRSRIYTIRPNRTTATTLSQHYEGPLDLAVGARGRLYVARLGSGKISLISNGRSSTYAKMPRLLAVETDERARLYAVRDAGSSAQEPAALLRVG